ncbi:phosphoinositide-3-kinase-interacting protein 1 [Syngnathoides biaculeatus]|uniref:phosphoinositide-3-kinase-interacting protein 1 n=1 Tax=Syngnathoides biaculeatus TaxID=300417 RepID=UPI002ADDC228|nr:phosphoinositide-3-kinase-interacting protein 1 [Syngnathoides biaculeatus]
MNSIRQRRRMFLSLHVVFLSAAFVDGSVLNARQKDCIESSGEDYRGDEQTSSSGLTCLKWTNTSTQYDPQTGVGDHNYCRNPDSSARPWCHIAGPDGTVQKQFCSIQTCQELASGEAREAETTAAAPVPETDLPPETRSAPGGAAADAVPAPAVQPAMGISQRVRTGPKKKKDLGTLGYALGIVMVAVIIVLGAGITFGYFYKRGRDLKKRHEQRACEREMQRITLPLSAFSNPTCELVDENTLVVTARRETTPVEAEGADPLTGQRAGTPGARPK